MSWTTWPHVLQTRLLRCYYRKNNWLYGCNSWEKNCSNVCFLFLLVLFREILKTQLLNLRISSSPVQVKTLSPKTAACKFVVLKLCVLGHPAMELGWAIFTFKRPITCGWALCSSSEKLLQYSSMITICINAVGGDLADLTEWIVS